MILTIEGKRYDFEFDKLRLSELTALKVRTGLTLRPFKDAIGEVDPDAFRFLVWLLRTRAGEVCDYDALDFDLSEIDVEDPPDPTSGATSAPDETSTSAPSLTSSGSQPETIPAGSTP